MNDDDFYRIGQHMLHSPIEVIDRRGPLALLRIDYSGNYFLIYDAA